MWQCKDFMAAGRSRTFDRRPQPPKGLPQWVVGNAGEAIGDPFGSGGIRFGAGFADFPAGQGGLTQRNRADGLPSKKAVHPLDNQARLVLDFNGCRPLNPQYQRTRFAVDFVVFALPLHTHRLGIERDVGAYDLRPAGDDFARGEALFLEGVGKGLVHEVGQLAKGGSFDGLVHQAGLCHTGKMTVAARTAARKRDTQAIAGPRAEDLLVWYDRHRRKLPWRALPGERMDPYRVWLSEIMLQQTQVATVLPYFERFLAKFATVTDLAAADIDDVLRLWAGLGYYARGRNLHACARVVAEQHGGKFPDTEQALAELPGIGPYTAAAIAAIAFDRKASPVDGNIERVIARLYALEEQPPAAKPVIKKLAAELTPEKRAGDFAQAMMDLGSAICTPKSPACGVCPWSEVCTARFRGDAETFPRKAKKAAGKLRRGAAFVAIRADGHALVRTRAAKGLLGGMAEVPTTEWTRDFDENAALDAAPLKAKWQRLPGVVTHVFTHFPLELVVYAAKVPARAKAPDGARFVPLDQLAHEAFPSVMRKVLAHAEVGSP